MTTLRDFFEETWSNDTQQVSKHAAAAGMTAEEWQRQTVQENIYREEQDKIAAENNVISGMVTGKGIKDGFAAELQKFANAGGQSEQAANVLYSVFCKD